MRPVRLVLLLVPFTYLPRTAPAQTIRAEDIPVRALIEFDSSSGDVEGVVMEVFDDTVLVQVTSGGGEVEDRLLPVESIRSMRIKETGPVWTYRPGTAARWELMEYPGDSTAHGEIMVLTTADSRIIALDAYTGETRWQIDLEPGTTSGGLIKLQNSQVFLLAENLRLSGVDMRTGNRLWRGADEPDEIRGLVDVGRDSLLLVLRASDEGRPRVVAMNTHTGATIWELKNMLAYPIAEHGSFPAVSLSDSATSVIYVSRDGPVLIDDREGKILWRGRALAGRPVPDRSSGIAAPTADDSTVYVATDRGIAAFDRDTGALLWERSDDGGPRPSSLRKTPWGLLVMGRENGDGEFQFQMLARNTGDVIWKARSEDGFRTIIRPGAVFVAGNESIEEIDLATGARRTVAEWKKLKNPGKFRSAVGGFTMGEDGYYLGWTFGALTLDSQGREKYRIELDPPGASFGESLSSGLTGSGFTRPGGTGHMGTWYVFTGEPAEPEIAGFSVARIDQIGGEISGRVWLDERHPSYWLSDNFAYALTDENQVIAAYPFTGCQAFDQAAAVGAGPLLDTLMLRGMGPGKISSLDCRPVVAAGSAGRTSIVAKLLAAGWSPDEFSREGWTALHHAAADGNLELVQLLLESGAEASETTLGDYPMSPLLLAIRAGQDSVVAVLEAAGVTASPSTRLLMESWADLEAGKIEPAIEKREQALAMTPEPDLPPRYVSRFCYASVIWEVELPWPDDCDRGIELNPDDPFAHLSRGIQLGLSGDYAGAESDLHKCFELDPFGADAQTCYYAAVRYARGEQPITPEFLERSRSAATR